ncbi:hypothetical protein GCM10028785_25310 [Hydrogenophaga soli]
MPSEYRQDAFLLELKDMHHRVFVPLRSAGSRPCAYTDAPASGTWNNRIYSGARSATRIADLAR